MIYLFLRTNRMIARFFDSFSQTGNNVLFEPPSMDVGYRRLTEAMKRIVDQINSLRFEKERDLHFYSQAIDQVNTPLMAFDATGRILLSNRAILSLFGIDSITKLDSLSQFMPGLPDMIQALKPGRSQMLVLTESHRKLHLLANVSAMNSERRSIKLISLIDIRNELEQREIKAWQHLIQVINHEIINSLVPVNLLSSGLIMDIEDELNMKDSLSDPELYNRLLQGLNTIKTRSKGLTQFVDHYRETMRIKTPDIEKLSLGSLIDSVMELYREEIRLAGIIMEKNLSDKEITVHCDRELIGQVLINLVRNSMQALSGIDNPYIRISGESVNDKVRISVIDNGSGIEAGNLPLIFTPAFSTRENGLGIGLSLSQQIIGLHGGTILVDSNPGIETIFTIELQSPIG